MDELHLLTRLNAETQSHHADADSDVDRYLFCDGVSAVDYRTYLQRVYGFLVPLEAGLATAPDLNQVIDVRGRTKSALVARDSGFAESSPHTAFDRRRLARRSGRRFCFIGRMTLATRSARIAGAPGWRNWQTLGT